MLLVNIQISKVRQVVYLAYLGPLQKLVNRLAQYAPMVNILNSLMIAPPQFAQVVEVANQQQLVQLLEVRKTFRSWAVLGVFALLVKSAVVPLNRVKIALLVKLLVKLVSSNVPHV